MGRRDYMNEGPGRWDDVGAFSWDSGRRALRLFAVRDIVIYIHLWWFVGFVLSALYYNAVGMPPRWFFGLAATAFFAATIAVVQTDTFIPRALSTFM
mgnify:CR=1 FL=1